MITITKEFSFSYGHKLYCEKYSDSVNKDLYGHCTNVHGHNAILRVTVCALDDSDTIPENGMLINFSVLKEIVDKHIIQKLDHTFLNDNPELPQPPTCENLVVWIGKQLDLALKQYGLRCYKVTLYETPTAYAEWFI